MNLPFLIARRLASPSPGNRPGVMERIAVVAVALSVAVMIVALAVILGFKYEVTRKMTGLAAHAELTDVRSLRSPGAQPIRRSDSLERMLAATEGFRSATPYALKGGIVRTDDGMQGLLLKGIDASYDASFLGEHLTAGALPRVGDTVRTKDLLLSQGVADRLRLSPGDRVEMLFIEGDAPRRDRFRVSGLFSTGMEEMDDRIAITDLRNVQRLSDWAKDEITGYEIRFSDFRRADRSVRELNRALLLAEFDHAENLAAVSVGELYPEVFDWLRTHDVNAAVVIGIMLAVAFFNMSSALLILVLERTQMIGLLKAMGMRNGSLRSLFLYRACFVVARGMAWGNLAGIGLCLMQRHFHLVRLDAAGYLLSEVPVRLEWGWWGALNAGAAALVVVLLLLPASMIAFIRPDESIRYE